MFSDADDIDHINYDFIINDYEKIKKYLDGKSLSTVNKCASVSRIVIPLLNFPEDVKDQYIKKYLKIVQITKSGIRNKGVPPKPKVAQITLAELPEAFINPPVVVEQPTPATPIFNLAPKKEFVRRKNNDEQTNKKAPAFKQNNTEVHMTIDQLFDYIQQNEKLSVATIRNYRSDMHNIVDRLKQTTLDFIVAKPEQVMEFLNGYKYTSISAFYNALLKVLSYLDFPEQNKKDVLEQYRTYFKSKKGSQTQSMQKDYKGYDYESLRTLMLERLQVEKNDRIKLLIALFFCAIPRRSSDYCNMLVNKPDDNKHNILVLNDKEQKFIFNMWKNMHKKHKQVVPITNPTLIEVLKAHIQKHPKDKYLLGGMTEKTLPTVLNKNFGSKGVPFNIRNVRHLFSTHLFKNRSNPMQLEVAAHNMGTSSRMLLRYYIDHPEKYGSYLGNDVDRIMQSIKQNDIDEDDSELGVEEEKKEVVVKPKRGRPKKK
jgi:integrase